MPRVFVAGATGYLGRHTVSAFKRHGWVVRALARSPDRLGLAAADADEVVTANATVDGALGGACDGVDCVFTSLGITRQTDKVNYQDVDYGANRRLLDEAVRGGVRRFVFTSVLNPTLTRHTDMVAARERLVDELRAAPLESVVLRPSGFFADLAEVFAMVRRGRAYLIGDGSARSNPIHGADLAEVAVEAATSDQYLFEVGGPDTFSAREVAELAFEVLGKPPKITSIPSGLADLVVPLIKPFHRRTWNIAAFMTTVIRNDMVGAARGTHHLRDYFRELANKGGA